MIHMTVALIIFTNDPVVNRYCVRFSPVFEQIGIFMPLHGLRFVFEPGILAMREKTTDNFPTILLMAAQHRKRINVTSLSKAADVFRIQRCMQIQST